MRQVTLSSIQLRNFKGTAELSLYFGTSSEVWIYGANEAGKTTIADAWHWLLTGKDSVGRADAEIKPLRANGTSERAVECSVTAVIVEGGVRHVLMRTMVEKWTRKRGSAAEEFTGHATTYEIDGVPVREKDWQDRIGQWVGSDARLLSDTSYFCSVLPWRERRRLMLAVCGDVDDAAVYAHAPDVAPLAGLLAGKSLADFRAILTAALSKANNELETIPSRIDEARRAIVADAGDADALAQESDRARQRLQEARDALAAAEADGGAAEARAKQTAARARLKHLQDVRDDNYRLDRTRGQVAVRDAEDAASRAAKRLDGLRPEKARIEGAIAAIEGKIAAKRAEWHAERDSPVDVAEKCAACGQSLPVQQAQGAANAIRAQRLAAIQQAGQSLANALAAERERLSLLDAEGESARAALSLAESGLTDAKAALDSLAKAAPDAEETALAEQIEPRRFDFSPGDDALAAVRDAVRAAEHAVAEVEKRRAVVAANKRAEARVQELIERQGQLAVTAEDQLGHIALCDAFIVAKCDLMEERVNSQFGSAKFRLFERQINGGINECCEVTYKGVPYADLNHAAKVNVGVECCGVLAEHAGVRLPIWIDGRESVTALARTEAQTISLVVSPADKVLRVAFQEYSDGAGTSGAGAGHGTSGQRAGEPRGNRHADRDREAIPAQHQAVS